ncbi:M48 family metalloprotease [Streptomyces sp. NPDC059564]|uniref:M48 family metalloprotease n=1 Tax=Streptomyces sp. NPDC059564 TaxID=3346865 RepID=UPI0036A288C5
MVRRWRQHRSVLARAWSATGDSVPDGDLLVVPGPDPQAFALPGWRGRGGRIVVTTGMLRAFGPAEREVLFSHERAHLAGRHHLLCVTAHLAGAAHRLAATAIARAALAAASGKQRDKGRGPLLSVGTGPVPQRVEALLRPVPVRPQTRTTQMAAAGLAAAVAGAVVLGLVMAYGLHEYVELTARALLRR